MQKFNLCGENANIAVYSNLDYDIIDDLENMFQKYLTVTDFEKEADYSVCLFKEKYDLNFSESLNGYDIFISKIKKKIYSVVSGEYSEDNILYIKRLIESLRNRILESKGAIFLHGASISIDGKTAIFIGDNNAGKTTTMLNYLAKEKVKYVSNDRVALINQNGVTKVIGSPTNIGIRLQSIEENQRLRSKFSAEEIKNARFDSRTRMSLSVQKLKEKLNIEEEPISDLQWLFYLQHSQNGECCMKSLGKEEMLSKISSHIVDGVFKKNAIINKSLDVSRNSLEDVLNNNVYMYEFKQDGDCTPMLKNIFLKQREEEVPIL